LNGVIAYIGQRVSFPDKKGFELARVLVRFFMSKFGVKFSHADNKHLPMQDMFQR
jgi:hypothetical protein